MADSLVQGLRHGIRALRREPGVTATAVFSVAEALMFTPLPFPASDRIEVAYPDSNGGWRVSLTPLQDELTVGLDQTVTEMSVIVSLPRHHRHGCPRAAARGRHPNGDRCAPRLPHLEGHRESAWTVARQGAGP